MPGLTSRMGTCMIYNAVLAPDIREISPSILSVWEPVPPLWLCPGTGWLLSPCLTNQAPRQQISLLPIPVDIMRPDLQAARGVCVRARVRTCVTVYQCLCVSPYWWRGMGEERKLKRLEIYWLPFAVSLPPLPSSLGLLFPASLFMGQGVAEGRVFCSAVCYRVLVTGPHLKHHSRGLVSAPAPL